MKHYYTRIINCRRSLILRFFATGFYLSSLTFVGCTGSNVKTLGAAAAVKGQSACSAAEMSYRDVDLWEARDERYQNFVKALTRPAEMTDTPESKVTSFSNELSTRISAFQALKRVYARFQSLSEAISNAEAKEATQSLLESLDTIQGIKDVPESVKKKIANTADILVEDIQAGKVRKHNAILARLASAYQELWQSEIPIWEKRINRVVDDYNNGLIQIDATRFDQNALSKIESLPFSTSYNITMYKLRLREESEKIRQETISRLWAVNSALESLVQAHTELSKKEPNLAEIATTLDRLDTIINTATK